MFRTLLATSVAAAALISGAAFAATTFTANGGGSSLAAPTYIAEYQKITATQPKALYSYEAVGSGSGQNAFLDNDISLFENLGSGILTYGTIVGTTVHFGASDAYLVASQLTNPATGSYGLSSVDGPLIQLPTIGVGVAMAYNYPSEKTVDLTDDQVCGILSGKLTNWSQVVPGASGNITVIYRSDGSGTTFLTTQHLNAVCTSSNSSFPVLPVPITKTFASIFTNSTPPANFVGESGSQAVAVEGVAVPQSFTYLSPDYTDIAPKSANATTLQVAYVLNPNDGVYYQPTVTNTLTGLANPGPNSTDPTPPETKTAAQNPLNWVPSIPTTTTGYSIVGYTTVLISSCYANKTIGKVVGGWLNAQYFDKPYQTIIVNNGFAPLPNTAAAPFASAIKEIFLTNKSKFGLDIDDAKTCSAYAGR